MNVFGLFNLCYFHYKSFLLRLNKNIELLIFFLEVVIPSISNNLLFVILMKDVTHIFELNLIIIDLSRFFLYLVFNILDDLVLCFILAINSFLCFYWYSMLFLSLLISISFSEIIALLLPYGLYRFAHLL